MQKPRHNQRLGKSISSSYELERMHNFSNFFVLLQCTRLTDRHTDRRRDGRTDSLQMENWNMNDVFAKFRTRTSSTLGCHLWALKLWTAFVIMRTTHEVTSSASGWEIALEFARSDIYLSRQ